jgi:hypothetical protein
VSPLCLSGSGRIDLLVIVNDSAQGQLTTLGGDHLAGHPHLITEVHVMTPVLEDLWSNSVKSDHDLQVAGAITQSCEAQLPAIPTQDDPPGDRGPATRTRVGREFTGLRSNLRQRVGPREGHRIGVDALFPQPVELLAAYPDLFRQPFD